MSLSLAFVQRKSVTHLISFINSKTFLMSYIENENTYSNILSILFTYIFEHNFASASY